MTTPTRINDTIAHTPDCGTGEEPDCPDAYRSTLAAYGEYTMTVVLTRTDVQRLPDWGHADRRYYNIGRAHHDAAHLPVRELVVPPGWRHTRTFQSEDYWYAELVAQSD